MNRLTIVCVLTFIIGIFGHAKLEYPKPYNPNPSTAAPCGGAAPLTIPAAIWTQQDQLHINWTVVAGDGNGQVLMGMDTTGGTTFTSANPNYVTMVLSGSNPTSGANKPYVFTFTVPSDLVCTSANGMCPVQVHAAGWYACTNIQVRAYVPSGSSASSTGVSSDTANVANVNQVKCQTLTGASGVAFCDYKVGADVQIGSGETPEGVDLYVKNTFNQNLNNVNVFANGTLNPDCATLYKYFLCDSSFPPCGTAASTGLRGEGSCKQRCYDTMIACGVTNIHSGLYPCDSYPDVCFACRMSVMSMIASVLLPLLMALYNRL